MKCLYIRPEVSSGTPRKKPSDDAQVVRGAAMTVVWPIRQWCIFCRRVYETGEEDALADQLCREQVCRFSGGGRQSASRALWSARVLSSPSVTREPVRNAEPQSFPSPVDALITGPRAPGGSCGREGPRSTRLAVLQVGGWGWPSEQSEDTHKRSPVSEGGVLLWPQPREMANKGCLLERQAWAWLWRSV